MTNFTQIPAGTSDLSNDVTKLIIVSNKPQYGIKLPYYFGAKVVFTEKKVIQDSSVSTIENRGTVYNTFTKIAEADPEQQTKTGCYEVSNASTGNTKGIRYKLYLSGTSVTYTDNDNNKEHLLYQLMLDVTEGNSSVEEKTGTINIYNKLGIYTDKFVKGIDTSTVNSPQQLKLKITLLAGINEQYVVEVYGIDGVSGDKIVFDETNNDTSVPLFTYTSEVLHKLWCKVKKTIDGGNTYTYITDNVFIAKIISTKTATNGAGESSTTYTEESRSSCEPDGYFKLDLPVIDPNVSNTGRYLIRVYSSSSSSVPLSGFDYYFSVGANDTWELKLYEKEDLTTELRNYTAHYSTQNYCKNNVPIFAVLYKNNVAYKTDKTTHEFKGSILEDDKYTNNTIYRLYGYAYSASGVSANVTIKIWDTSIASNSYTNKYEQTSITLSYKINPGQLTISTDWYSSEKAPKIGSIRKDSITYDYQFTFNAPSTAGRPFYYVTGDISCTLTYGNNILLKFNNTLIRTSSSIVDIQTDATNVLYYIYNLCLDYSKSANSTINLEDSELDEICKQLKASGSISCLLKLQSDFTKQYSPYISYPLYTNNDSSICTLSSVLLRLPNFVLGSDNNKFDKLVVLTPFSNAWNNLGFNNNATHLETNL